MLVRVKLHWTNPWGPTRRVESPPLKPPPAARRRGRVHTSVRHSSVFGRLWSAVRIPSAVTRGNDKIVMDERLRRRRFLLTAGAMASVVAAAWGLYQYIASAPLRAQSAFLEGMRLKGAGSYDEATRRFTEAVYIWPQMTEGYLQRGLARQSMNQVDAAIEDFEHVIKQDPGNGAAHRALGVIYRERGELNRAVSEFTVSTSLTGDADAFYQ